MKATSFLLLIAISCILTACTQRRTEDQKFEALAKDYIEKFLGTHPESATTLGDHRFDARLNDYTLAGVEADRRLSKSGLDSLASIDATKLSAVNKIDYRIFKTNLESTLYQLDTLREYEWNPLNSNGRMILFAGAKKSRIETLSVAGPNVAL